MAHKHFCDIAGHEWQCGEAKCVCICGTPLNEGDHSGCPSGLVGCPEHVAEQQHAMSERTFANCEFDAKCHRADTMPDGPERDALVRDIVLSIFPGADIGEKD